MNTRYRESDPLESHSVFLAHTPILAYHQVVSDTAFARRSPYIMPVSQFELQMKYLHDTGYRCLTLMEFLQSKGLRSRSQDKGFVLTFDDGYENFLTTAYPILRRYGFTATVFLVANFIGKTNHWDKKTKAPLLTWEQIKELHDAGVFFGSHTSSHPHLPELSNEQIKHELANSKKHLEYILGQEISFLAYPYGESSGAVRKIAMQTGYFAACGVITGQRGRYNLWRRPCESQDSLLIFGFKLTRWYLYFLRLLRWAREDTFVGDHLRKIRKKQRSNNKNRPLA